MKNSTFILMVLAFFYANCNGRRIEKLSYTPTIKSKGQPWPLPKSYISYPNYMILDVDNFVFLSGGAKCDILDDAFERYADIMFGGRQKEKPLLFEPEQAFPFPSSVIHNITVTTKKACQGQYPSISSDESYQLKVSLKGAFLTSNEVWGALRGLETFSQLVHKLDSGKVIVNYTDVDDAPRFPHRSVMLDTSRHYLKKDTLFKNLEAMAQNKFNVFHWHMTDRPSFPFQSMQFPDLSLKGAFNPTTHVYTPSDVQDVIEFARRRGIRVMVEFDTPGHSTSWGKGMPDLLTKCYSKGKFDGEYGPINPSLNSTYDFLEKFFAEVASVFPDHYLFLGGDEVSFSCWESNPDITKFMKKMGFGTHYAKLEEYYMQRLLDIVARQKKGYMIWQDVVDNGATVKSDTVVEVWRHSGYQKELAKVTKLGHKTLLSACWYLNYISYGSDWAKYYECDPQNFNGTQAQKDLIVGGEACMWGSWVDDTNLIPRLWPRASAVGEKLWSQEHSTTSSKLAQPRIAEHRCRMVRPLLFEPEQPFPFPSSVIHNITVTTKKACQGQYPSLSSDESYELKVSLKGAFLTSNEVWGALRGLETFSQLVHKLDSGKVIVNYTDVDDAPRFPHRSIMLDTSRHYIKKDTLLKNLEAMAQNKFNVFHWHMTDRPSFPYQSMQFPELSLKGAFNPTTHVYTPSDVQDVIEFARRRGIRVMVEFDTPGHIVSWGKGIPDLLTKCYSKGKFDGEYGPINPSLNSTYDFLEKFFAEVASVFPDHYLFLGGDEVSFSCWESNPDITKFMKKMGFGTHYAKLEEYYVQRLQDIVASQKKGSMIWQDLIDNGLIVKSDTMVDVWRHSGYQKELDKITKLGLKTVLSACWYLNSISYGSDWHKYYECDPQNFDGTQAQKDLIVGGEACMWGSYVDDTNLMPRLWPRASAVGENLWSQEHSTTSTKLAQPRIAEHRCRMVRRGFRTEELVGAGFCEDD